MPFRALAVALVLLPPLSALAAVLGPEIPVTDPPVVPAPGRREGPRVASNGDGFVAVWYDRRGEASEIRAARLDRDGRLIDAQSRLIAAQAGPVTSVASNGRDYLVSFHCAATSTPNICLSRVDEGTGSATRAAAVEGMHGALAPNGNGYLLVYQSASLLGAQPMRALALREDGSAAGAPFTIGAGMSAPAVATNGRAFFAVWSSYAHLEGVLLSDRSTSGNRQVLTSINPSFGPGPFGWAVASDGDGFLVAWQQNTGVVNNRYTTDLRVRSVSAGGVPGASRTVVAGEAWEPALAWTGSEYLLTFTHSTAPAAAPYLVSGPADVRALALTASGEPRGEAAPLAAGAGQESSSAVASSRLNTLVVWENLQRHDAALVEGRLAGQQNDFVISNAAAWQQNPSLSRESARTLVAWEENAGEAQLSRVVLHRYESNVFNNPGRKTFALPSSPRHQRRPVVASDIVAWMEEEPNGSGASVWWHPLDLGRGSYEPWSTTPERLEAAMPGTRLHVFRTSSFLLFTWTAPDGRLKGAYRVTVLRIGYDRSSFYVTDEPALNPASDGLGPWPLIAYNRPVPRVCPAPCEPISTIRATVLAGRTAGPAIDVAPEGASAPDVVFDGTDSHVFWSMPDGGAYVQRVSTAGGVPVAIGAPRKIHDGRFHDATLSRNQDIAVVVEEGDRFALLRLDRNGNVVESIPFRARLIAGSRIQVSADRFFDPMIAYATPRPDDGASSRVVLRLVGDAPPAPKQRGTR